jgi:hypothetical protein
VRQGRCMSASVRGDCHSVSHSAGFADCLLVLVKEASIDGHVFFHSLAYFDPEPEVFEQAAQPGHRRSARREAHRLGSLLSGRHCMSPLSHLVSSAGLNVGGAEVPRGWSCAAGPGWGTTSARRTARGRRRAYRFWSTVADGNSMTRI